MKAIYDIIRKEFDDGYETWEDVKEQIHNIVLNDDFLMNSWGIPLIKKALNSMVEDIGRSNNNKILKGESVCPKGVSGETLEKDKKKNAVIEIKVRETTRIIDIYLNVCKKKLGDATGHDLDLEIKEHRRNRKGNEINETFKTTIRDGLSSRDKRVKQEYSDHKLKKLYDRIEKRINNKWDKYLEKIDGMEQAI